ncbi:MAG: winged helix-turn-helix transcriptional regulator [Planctomycetes bacterium]|nr:winged helix-turn-helix transcriptional regulator [Planctomycetota bacterium]
MSKVLTLGLLEVQSSALIERRIVDQYPPTSSYRLTRRGRWLVPVLQRLERRLDVSLVWTVPGLNSGH